MRRIGGLIAVAAAAALLGLAAAVLGGARICKVIATELPAPAPHVRASSSGDKPADEPRRAAETEETAAAADRAASPLPPPPPARRRRARPVRQGRSSAVAVDPFFEQLGRGITQLDEHRYAIAPSALEHALADLRSLSRAVRIAPEVREGKPSGYKLVWVMTDGPIAKLGLRADDVLVSVNGLDITTPDRVLDAYGKLRAARRLVLGLVREGRRSTLEYVIR
jgi:C-terminal processing protease CtpA/Prc